MKDKIFLIGFLIIVALPLLASQPYFSPPDWGKTIVFRIVSSLLIFIFLWQFLSKKRTIKNHFPLAFYFLVALLLIYSLATIFSLDVRFSLWGSPYRSDCFINFALYLLTAILAFLVLKKEDWQKVLSIGIFIGFLVSLLAIVQWQGLFKTIIKSVSSRPPSTLGNPIMLALYLLLLTFITLSLAIKTKTKAKRIFYLLAFFVFIFTIFLTYSRAIWLGLVIGFIYFIFFYPFKKKILSLTLKVSLVLFLLLGSLTIYYLNNYPLPQSLQNNKTIQGAVNRLSIKKALNDPRISGYKVGWQALKERPLLGYGPENFSIGFDKFYDPALPGIEKTLNSSDDWWDRAHNFIFDISVSAGLPALIIFLSLLSITFYQLRKVKERDDKITAHGLQATFIAYLVANFFSFDAFSIYLILFLLIAYSFFLIERETTKREIGNSLKATSSKILKGSLFLLLIYFILAFNIKPFLINKEINQANLLVKKDKERAIEIMEKALPKKSYLDHYLILKYVELVKTLIEEKELNEARDLIERTIKLLEEATIIRPYYTRDWLLLSQYNNLLLENWQEVEDKEWQKEKEEEIKRVLEKAQQLSPKRQDILQELVKVNLSTKNYQEALTISKECINLNEKLANCYWLAGLSSFYLNNLEEGDYYLEKAKEKKYKTDSKDSQYKLNQAYIEIKNYQRLVKTYLALIKLEPDNPQYYASLAFVYKELKQIEEAKKITLKLIELFPAHKQEANAFLETLN